MKKINKPFVCAVLVFGAIALLATSVSAQDTVVGQPNPLFSTTGANVLRQGKIQWNSSLEYYHLGMHLGNPDMNVNINSLGAATGLRFGIGSRAELTLDVKGAYNTFDTTYFHNNTGFTPSVGAKLLLYGGKGLLPMVSFYTHVALPVQQYAFLNNRWVADVRPEIGLQFRNLVGRTWALDYSIGYSWDHTGTGFSNPENLLQYSFYFSKLIGDRMTIGAGFDNMNSMHSLAGNFEARWLATDDLQLTARAGMAAGIDNSNSGFAGNVNALLGVSWMIK